MLQTDICRYLDQRLNDHFGEYITLQYHEAIAGGDINEVYRLYTNKGSFLLKLNTASHGQDMFEKEVSGLRVLSTAATLKIPEPLFTGCHQQQLFLVME